MAGWPVVTCSKSYLFISGSIHTPRAASALRSAEPSRGVRIKNSSRSTGSSRCTVLMSCAMRSGVSPGKPALGLAGEECHSHLPRLFEIGWQPRQHRETSGDVKPADRNRESSLAGRRGEVHRPRELVRLHPEETDEPGIGGFDAPDDLADRDDGVALVIGADVDRNVRPERAAPGDVGRDAVEAGERIRRDPRFSTTGSHSRRRRNATA